MNLVLIWAGRTSFLLERSWSRNFWSSKRTPLSGSFLVPSAGFKVLDLSILAFRPLDLRFWFARLLPNGLRPNLPNLASAIWLWNSARRLTHWRRNGLFLPNLAMSMDQVGLLSFLASAVVLAPSWPKMLQMWRRSLAVASLRLLAAARPFLFVLDSGSSGLL